MSSTEQKRGLQTFGVEGGTDEPELAAGQTGKTSQLPNMIKVQSTKRVYCVN